MQRTPRPAAVGGVRRVAAAGLAAAGPGHTAQPHAFWRGWRLVALDGARFSLTHTPQVRATTRKAKTRRGRAAFAKITTGVLLELGLHNPLAAAIGRGGQSEWALALELLARRPQQALLLAGRLHGLRRVRRGGAGGVRQGGQPFPDPRPRRCPRAVRQPVSRWPRLRRNQSWEGSTGFQLL